MALQMIRPTKHPKSGTYRLRLTVPLMLRDAARARYGAGTEMVENLQTKDGREAKRLAPAAIARLEARLRVLQDEARGKLPEATDRDIQALAGAVYADAMETHGDRPGDPARWEIMADGLHDRISPTDDDPAGPRDLELTAVDLAEAEGRLGDRGMPTDPATVHRAAEAILYAKLRFTDQMKRRAAGDWSPDPNPSSFPTARPAPVAAPVVTFDAVLRGYAQDRGLSVDARPIDRAIYDRQQTIARLGVFLSHTDAAKVTKADAVRWKEDMQARGLAVSTIRNDLSEMSAIWRTAMRNGKLALNPFEGVSPPKQRNGRAMRRGFTADEAAAILTAARANKGYMRWLPWVCALTGARISEICQAAAADVATIEGVPVLRIHDEGDADEDGVRSIKNAESRRNVPIHPALVAEGFLAYVASLPARSPLFPDARPDKLLGLRSTNAGKKIARWLKADLQITDKRISPNHSWRHYFISACRGVQMHPEVRSALTGHSAKMDESARYGAGMKSFVEVLAENMAKVPAPVASVRTPNPPWAPS